MEEEYCIYIMANPGDTVLYIGCTSDLIRRVHEHKAKAVEGFSQKYNATKLVYFEAGGDYDGAREREIQLKKWSRKKKDWLIDRTNKERRDLYFYIV